MKLPIYLDHHSTTPVDPRVLEVMLPFFNVEFGNAASRSHRFGWKAEEAVEEGRASIAALIGANPKEIIFTSGATESNNLAILGAARANRDRGDHLITSVIEHPAVLDPFVQLEKEGFRVTRVGVDGEGRVDADEVERAITEHTLLISIMFVNNEVGSVQPLAEIGALALARNILFHTDAAQGIGKLPFNVKALNLDLVSISAHKLYGPKGVGALYLRRRIPLIKLQPLLFGGGHERGLRSGTLNVPAIAGFGKACAIYQSEWEAESQRLRTLRDRLFAGLNDNLDEIKLNGPATGGHPGNLNISFKYVEGESLLMELNKAIAVSAGSACTSASLEPSHVLKAMGVSAADAHAAIRFGIGRFNTAEEIDQTIEHVVRTVQELRRRSPAYELATKGGSPAQENWEGEGGKP